METSSCSHVTEIKHDVFISFRGTDVRRGLLSHLKKELCRKGIDVYVDERLERGDEISSALLRAIEGSQILLVIFSKDYASSKWCLEELSKMIECMQRNKQIVIPVFYNVDPSDVRHQRGDYGDALAKHEENFKEAQNWRSALKKASLLSGFHYPKNFENESDLIDEIVEDVLEKLIKFCPSESNGLVGIDQNIAQIQSLLIMESREVRFLGIWGMGGIGKTTIARAVFDKYSPQYDGCCFLNVREELEKCGLSYLREKLLSDLLEGQNLPTNGTSKARFFSSVKRWVSRKKVFIVLDDVNTSEQLKHLVGEPICFGPGSRVIVTSRDKYVLTSGGVHQIHEVKEMDFQDSLKLFCLNAFNESQPKMGYGKLSKMVVDYAKGLPLALKVLGSDFHSRNEEAWEYALSKLKKYPNEQIQSLLRFSYDGLHEVEKKAFLDVAFFFKEEDKDYVIRLLDDWGFYGASGIEALQRKALITISKDNRIQMHDLIQDMGYEIVRQESIKYPGRRSRLREYEEVYEVLRNNGGTHEVEAMQIDVSQIRDLLNVDTFEMMPRLRFLKLHHPLHVELSMLPSHVNKLLQGVKDLVNSKGTDLDTSRLLMDLSQFSMVSNIERGNLKSGHILHDLVISRSRQLNELLDLSEASLLDKEYPLESASLWDSRPSIWSLEKQVALILSGCKELMSIGSEIHVKSLHYLLIDGCSGPQEFSLSPTPKDIRQLNLTNPEMEILNSSIGHLSNLKRSDREGQQLNNLPSEIFCLGSTYYCRQSNSSGQDSGKPKLHILFDGLKYFQRTSLNFREPIVLQNTKAFSRCNELILDGWVLDESWKARLPPESWWKVKLRSKARLRAESWWKARLRLKARLLLGGPQEARLWWKEARFQRKARLQLGGPQKGSDTNGEFHSFQVPYLTIES